MRDNYFPFNLDALCTHQSLILWLISKKEKKKKSNKNKNLRRP
jgi:hypothetical protein